MAGANNDFTVDIIQKNCAIILFLVSYHTREPVVSKDETEYYIIRRVEQTREIMPMPFLPSKQIKEKFLFLWQKNLTPKKSKERILVKFSMNVDW